MLLVTYNEERRIATCLRDVVPWVDEVIIVDQSSSDATRAIAAQVLEQMSTRPDASRSPSQRWQIVLDEHRGYCEASRAIAAHYQTAAWTLVLDADETLSDPFKRHLRELIRQAQARGWHGYRLKRATSVDGECFHRPDDVHFRLFRRSSANYLDILHSAPQPRGNKPLGPTPEYICIEHHKTLQEELEDELRYEQIIAEQTQTPEWKAERLAWNVYLRAQREQLPAAEVERLRRASTENNTIPRL